MTFARFFCARGVMVDRLGSRIGDWFGAEICYRNGAT
jgi:hypothetical protein